MKSGYLICVEGIEGTGKSTQAKFIAQYLRQNHQVVLETREPGGTFLAEKIRNLLLEPKTTQETLTKETELLLLFAARAQHITHVIQPALEKGYWVICDRFVEASYAYQGGGRGIPVQLIHTLQLAIQKNLKVNCTFLMDMPVEKALHRLAQRNRKNKAVEDRIEMETKDFFTRVRQVYLNRLEQNASQYHLIQAGFSIKEVQKQIVPILDALLQDVDQYHRK